MSWSSSEEDSGSFKAWQNNGARDALRTGCGSKFRQNPRFPLASETISTPKLAAGVYDVSRHLKSISVDTPVQLKSGSYKLDNWPAWVSGNEIINCESHQLDPGCLRVSYRQSSATHLSFIAKLTKGGTSTQAWRAPASWMCSSGGSSSSVDLFSEGDLTADALVDAAQASNTFYTWILRLVGVAMAVFGIQAFFSPLQTIANFVDQFFDWFKFIPIAGSLLDFLGNVVAGAVGCAIFMVSLGIGVPSALTILAITWCVMRPLIGFPVLGLCVGLLFMTVQAMRNYAEKGRAKRKKA